MDDCDLRELAAAYVLGALDAEERERFEAHATRCPVCAREIDALRASVLVLAHASGQRTPPPDMRERIVAAIAHEPQAADSARAEPAREPDRTRFWRRRVTLTLVPSIAVAAAIVLALVLFTGGSSTPASLKALGPRYATVPLRGAGGQRTGSVYVNPAGKAVAFVSVPPAPRGKAYEAWVMVGGRATAAKPAGLFAGGAERYVVLATRAHRGDVVGFTLEPSSGSLRPTTEPLATANI